MICRLHCFLENMLQSQPTCMSGFMFVFKYFGVVHFVKIIVFKNNWIHVYYHLRGFVHQLFLKSFIYSVKGILSRHLATCYWGTEEHQICKDAPGGGEHRRADHKDRRDQRGCGLVSHLAIYPRQLVFFCDFWSFDLLKKGTTPEILTNGTWKSWFSTGNLLFQRLVFPASMFGECMLAATFFVRSHWHLDTIYKMSESILPNTHP